MPPNFGIFDNLFKLIFFLICQLCSLLFNNSSMYLNCFLLNFTMSSRKQPYLQYFTWKFPLIPRFITCMLYFAQTLLTANRIQSSFLPLNKDTSPLVSNNMFLISIWVLSRNTFKVHIYLSTISSKWYMFSTSCSSFSSEPSPEILNVHISPKSLFKTI